MNWNLEVETAAGVVSTVGLPDAMTVKKYWDTIAPAGSKFLASFLANDQGIVPNSRVDYLTDLLPMDALAHIQQGVALPHSSGPMTAVGPPLPKPPVTPHPLPPVGNAAAADPTLIFIAVAALAWLFWK